MKEYEAAKPDESKTSLDSKPFECKECSKTFGRVNGINF